jgi:hypothetical protein
VKVPLEVVSIAEPEIVISTTVKALQFNGRALPLSMFSQIPIRPEGPDDKLWGYVRHALRERAYSWLVYAHKTRLYRRALLLYEFEGYTLREKKLLDTIAMQKVRIEDAAGVHDAAFKHNLAFCESELLVVREEIRKNKERVARDMQTIENLEQLFIEV